jgi:hypothetical protein
MRSLDIKQWGFIGENSIWCTWKLISTVIRPARRLPLFECQTAGIILCSSVHKTRDVIDEG